MKNTWLYFSVLTLYENMISCQTCLKNIERTLNWYLYRLKAVTAISTAYFQHSVEHKLIKCCILLRQVLTFMAQIMNTD